MPDDFVCTNSSLRRAARRLGQLYDEALIPTGLTSTQTLLLGQIDGFGAAQCEEAPTLQVLAGRLGIQLSALTHALRPLVRDGLVEVHQNASDRRTKHAVLTSQGKARYQQACVVWVEVNRRVEAILGSEAAERLRSLADDVASQDFLDAYAAGGKLLRNRA
ncbi:MarR family transcriptional regulator [Mesorhizobium sp. M0488]|uniref:MarR family winged helix-turn-helix transcriptional regulator n=1 Tax=unclassified Mesorhizobium TaxID=325217 RepID=UPI00333BFEA7